jgi:hypothetical protein
MENLFFITIHGKSTSWTKKLSYQEGLRVSEGFLAYYGSRAGKHEIAAINEGRYSLKRATEDEFRAETRSTW